MKIHVTQYDPIGVFHNDHTGSFYLRIATPEGEVKITLDEDAAEAFLAAARDLYERSTYSGPNEIHDYEIPR